jgi:hypothetical protein
LKNCLLVILALLSLAGPARGAEPAPDEDLYLSALQAVAEGRHADASLIVARMIARGPSNAGEWLDLAMIQCAVGHGAEAEALFRDIEERFTPQPGILNIIEQQRVQGCRNSKPLSQWSMSVARGYDNNVNQGASNPYFSTGAGVPLELLPEYQPHGDRYSVLAGDYTRELGQNGDIGYLQLHLRQNDRLADYNTAAVFAGADHPWRWGRWKLRSSGLLGLLTLGGQLYQQQAQVQLRATPPLPLPERYEFSLLNSVSRTRYKTLSNFDATTLELRGVLGYRTDATLGQASLGYLYDQGNAERPGGDRSGWSARLQARTTLGSKLQGELDWNYQHWRGAADYSPGLIDITRNQNTNALRSTLIYPLSASQAVHLEWRWVRNRENISIFQYDSRQLQLSWRWYGQ